MNIVFNILFYLIYRVTKSEILAMPTAALTARLQDVTVMLAGRVGQDSPQHLHTVRQIDEMATEVGVLIPILM